MGYLKSKQRRDRLVRYGDNNEMKRGKEDVHEDHEGGPTEAQVVACRVLRDGVVVAQVPRRARHEPFRVDVDGGVGARDGGGDGRQHQVRDDDDEAQVARDQVAVVLPDGPVVRAVAQIEQQGDRHDDERRARDEQQLVHVVEARVALRRTGLQGRKIDEGHRFQELRRRWRQGDGKAEAEACHDLEHRREDLPMKRYWK